MEANLRLIDFGSSRIIESEETVYEDLAGTIYYLAPELAAKSSKIPTDMFLFSHFFENSQSSKLEI